MSCNTSLPVREIADEVKRLLNLGQYVKKENGVAEKLNLKGGVTLDAAAKESLCSALSSCLGKSIQSFTAQGNKLVLTTTDGEVFQVDLSGMEQRIKDSLTDEHLVRSAIRGNEIVLTMSSGAVHKVPLPNMRDINVSEFELEGNELVLTQSDGTKKYVDLASLTTPPTKFGNRALANDGTTVLGYWVNK